MDDVKMRVDFVSMTQHNKVGKTKGSGKEAEAEAEAEAERKRKLENVRRISRFLKSFLLYQIYGIIKGNRR